MAEKKVIVQPGDTVQDIAQNISDQSGATGALPGQEIKIDQQAPLTPNPRTPAPLTESPRGQAVGGVSTPPPLTFGQTTPPQVQVQPGVTGQTPLEALPVVGQPPAPEYPRPEMKGGQATFNLFNRLTSGALTLPPDFTPTTPAEIEAVQMYNNYQKYNTADSKTIFDAIQKGEITPDPGNVLWRAISQNGEPTPAMVEAFGWWKLAQERNAAQTRTKDPFLGGVFPKPTSAEEADALLNEDQNNIIENGGDTSGAMVNVDPTSVAIGDRYAEFESELRMMLNVAPPGAPEYEKSLLALRGQYGVTALEQQLVDLQKEYADMEAITRERLQYQMDQPVSMNVIAGRMSEVQRQQKERLDYLGREMNYRSNMIQTANNAISQIMDAKQMDYQVARQQWEDGVNAAKGLLQEFNAMRAQDLENYKWEVELAREQRKDAQGILDAYYNQITNGVLSQKDLTPVEMAQLGRLELQAGFPVGTFLNLRSKFPEADVKTQVERYDPNGNRYFDVIMQDRMTGQIRIETIAAGFDAEMAQNLAMGEMDILGKGLDVALKEDDLMYNRPLERENIQSQIADRAIRTQLDALNTESQIASRALTDQEKALGIQADYEIIGGPSPKADTTNYFKNLGQVTAYGSPLWKHGLDVDLKKGDPVFSPVAGEVVKVGPNGGFGNQVQIKDPNGNLVWLSHLDGIGVKVGDRVSAGAQVGIGGNSGNTIPGAGNDGSHLDITIKKPDGSYYSPQEVEKYINSNYSQMVGTSQVSRTTKSTDTKAVEKELRSDILAAIKPNSKGYITPAEFNSLKQIWETQGFTPAQFDSMMQGYIEPRRSAEYRTQNNKEWQSKNTPSGFMENQMLNIVDRLTNR